MIRWNKYDIAYSTTMSRSNLELTKYTTYITLTGKWQDVWCEEFEEN